MLKWIAIGVVVLLALGAAWYLMAGGGPAQRGKRGELASLKAQLAAAQQRGDANAIATLTRQIETAEAALATLGDASADPLGTQIQNSVASFDLVNPSLSDIIATDRSDWLKRGNIWRNALHFATDAQAGLASAVQSATTKEDLARLRTAVLYWGTKMRATQNRLYQSSHGGESGLDAYSGSPEPGGDDKAHAWLVSVVDPLWLTLGRLDAKLSAVDPANATLTAELAAVSATPSAPAGGVFGA